MIMWLWFMSYYVQRIIHSILTTGFTLEDVLLIPFFWFLSRNYLEMLPVHLFLETLQVLLHLGLSFYKFIFFHLSWYSDNNNKAFFSITFVRRPFINFFPVTGTYIFAIMVSMSNSLDVRNEHLMEIKHDELRKVI